MKAVRVRTGRPKIERIIRQLHQPADVDELQISVAQSAVGIGAGHADIVIDPEGDVAAEIAGGEDAEKPVSKSVVGTYGPPFPAAAAR